LSNRVELQCVIPARLGSKRIPRKNLIQLGGKPMLVWSIEAALESNAFDAVFVATESEEIAAVARGAGATVPFLLDDELCGDLIPSWRPCTALLEQIGDATSGLVCLQPTSPCRSPEDIRAGIASFEEGADFVLSVTELDPHYFHWAMTPEPEWKLVFGERYAKERPLLPKRYRPNGSIKIADRSALMRTGSFLGLGLRCFETPEQRSVHVGSDFELFVAKALLECGVSAIAR
jgi:CMP-N,N'-diacetyllegionaminic acid synthase